MRCVAVMLVLGMHAGPCPAEVSSIAHELTSLLATGGWVGVDLFFVLSGFLVSGLLFREHQAHGAISFQRFFIRRGFKIYPVFWLLLAFTVGFRLSAGQAIHWESVVCEFLFIQNYGASIWTHTWSLAVEEHFYLSLAVLLIWMARTGRDQKDPFRRLPRLFLILALTCLAIRLANGTFLPFARKVHQFATHVRVDSLFFGVLLSYWHNYHRAAFGVVVARWRSWMCVLGLVLLLPAFCFPLPQTPYLYIFGYSQFYLGSGLLLAVAVDFTLPSNRIVHGMAYVGAHSYSIYVWHVTIGDLAVRSAIKLIGSSWNWYLEVSVYLASTIVLGCLLSVLVEYPLLRLRDRLTPSRSGALKVAD